MDLHHHFTVPASIDDTWAAFNDLQRIGSCLPGATITSVDGDEFTGTVKVKLGPISLQYNGTGSYTERDKAAGKVVIVAKGKDKRGNGTASATITATLAADGTGTAVDVGTDLAITGKPAQFGRGVIQDVSDQLLGQFVECIRGKLTPAAAGAVSADAAAFPPADSPTPPPATDTLSPSELPAAKPPSAERTAPAETAGAAAGAGLPIGRSDAAPLSGAASEPVSGSGSGAVSGPVSGPPAAEIDLMSTVGPVLVKRYAKPAAGVALAVGLFLVLRRLFGGSSS